ncbi:ATP-binding protein [Aureimonas endophytica]|uniref:ATP-binding protein n=1 Tax=Aureimonas endophytica TaxID=2027858 RepID=A0A917E024_9HYPH|nr:DUF1849 family protein [Aureimonas endophytica]GGD89459.1 ATP-binding protein [Aureimonas endophytica]
MTIRLLVMAAAMLAPAAAGAAMPFAAHQAIYDLKLSAQDSDIADANGRIAMKLDSNACGVWNLDYRFVARFRQEQEVTLTDLQTKSTENVPGQVFTFSTKTFVDGSPEKEIRGEARHDAGATRVAMEAPEKKEIVLPLSLFPVAHTQELIRRAANGERIVETKLFDGDDDAEKLLSSTAIIAPIQAKPTTAAAAPTADGAGSEIRAKLQNMAAWRVSESYYNSDSDPDGMPVFQTTYVLYENGVSDDLTLDFGTYSLSGSLKKLDLLDTPRCQ